MFNAFDNSLFYFINKTCANRFFDFIMPLLTELGEWKFILVFAIILLFFRNKDVKKYGLLLLIGFVISFALVYILKNWIARPRPFMVLSHIRLFTKEGGFAFPSGHATFIFMAISVLTNYFKKFYYFYLLAFTIVFSRVYVGAHFPTDVIFGGLNGAVIGYLVVKISRRF